MWLIACLTAFLVPPPSLPLPPSSSATHTHTHTHMYVGSRSIDVMRHLIVDHVASLSDNKPSGWPHFKPLQWVRPLQLCDANNYIIMRYDRYFQGQRYSLNSSCRLETNCTHIWKRFILCRQRGEYISPPPPPPTNSVKKTINRGLWAEANNRFICYA